MTVTSLASQQFTTYVPVLNPYCQIEIELLLFRLHFTSIFVFARVITKLNKRFKQTINM